MSSRSPATSPTTRTAARSSPRPGRDRPAREQREHPRPSPQPALADYPLDVLERVYAVNVLAPLALIQLAVPGCRRTVGSST